MEYGIPYSLVTPSGTLTFNPSPSNQDGLYLSDVQGLDGGEVRLQTTPLPQRDGAYVFDSYRGALYPTLTGFIRAGTTSARTTFMDSLKGLTDSIRAADGTLKFTPSGQSQRQLAAVRLAAPVQIGNGSGILKTFQLQLVAGNPLVTAVAGSSGQVLGSSIAATGGALSFVYSFPFGFGDFASATAPITPGGNAPAWPVVTLLGPISSPTIKNQTTGLLVRFPGLTLAATDTLTVDMFKQLAYVNADPVGSSNSRLSYLDFTVSTFWSLTAGVANTILVSGTGYSAGTTCTVSYNDTWI
jgi:hypothetical protein